MSQSDADITFLALAIWREARGESALAQVAVAWVVMTRVKRGGWMGDNVMEVLFKPEQFSSLTAQGDPQLRNWPLSDDLAWVDALTIAQNVYQGSTANPCPNATHYYDQSIEPPTWTIGATFIKQIGKLRFFEAR